MSRRHLDIVILAVIFAGGAALYLTAHRSSILPSSPNIELMYQEYRKSFPEILELTVDDFLKLRSEQQVVLVDVRTDAERAVSVIPGAISEADFDAHRDHFRNLPVIAYCTIGYRSGLFAKKTAGPKVYNLIGGVLAWARAGQEFSSADRPTRRVHVYGKEWDLLPDGYTAVW